MSKISMAFFNHTSEMLEDKFSRPMCYSDLLKRSENDRILEREFKTLPNPMPKVSEDDPEADPEKNRYANVIPNPMTRVRLRRVDATGSETQGYINANFVRGHKKKHQMYIATQAPLDSTVQDFWTMVWQNESQVGPSRSGQARILWGVGGGGGGVSMAPHGEF
jgi:protein tyrosine phosphatase